MSLNDSTLEGDFAMSNKDWNRGVYPGYSKNRTKLESFIKTRVKVNSMDGISMSPTLILLLVEISDKGFLLRCPKTEKLFFTTSICMEMLKDD